MSSFNRTVALLAQQPRKVALMPAVPSVLLKTAAPKTGTGMFDVPRIASNVATALATTAITGAAGGLAYHVQSRFFGDPDQARETSKETGKLNARANQKLFSISLLKPQHEKVLKTLQAATEFNGVSDEELASAYGTMKRFAPNLAADENAARSFLREHLYKGTLNSPHYSTIKLLVDTERAVAEAGGLAGYK